MGDLAGFQEHAADVQSLRRYPSHRVAGFIPAYRAVAKGNKARIGAACATQVCHSNRAN
jgi:hypothetical protein